VGRAAAGELKEVEALSEAERAAASDNDGDGGLIEHRFVLREGFELRIELPADFTAHEAARVADFVKALPFGSDR
jgi:hypothetical protein